MQVNCTAVMHSVTTYSYHYYAHYKSRHLLQLHNRKCYALQLTVARYF